MAQHPRRIFRNTTVRNSNLTFR